MGCVVAAFGSVLLEYRGEFLDGMREGKDRTAEHRQCRLLSLGGQFLDLLFCTVDVDVHLLRVKGKVLDV